MLPINIDGTGVSGITIDGTEVTEVTVDGDVVFAPSAIPDSVVSLYEFEDDSDTTTAVDSQGSNNLVLNNGPTYSTTPAVGDLALSTDGSDDYGESESTVDLTALGDTNGFGISVHLNPSSVVSSGTNYIGGWGPNNNNWLYIVTRDGDWSSFLQVGGTNDIIESTVAASTSEYIHIYAEVTETDHRLFINETQEASSSHGLDPTAIGSGPYTWGASTDLNNYYDGLIDDIAFVTDPLSDSELNTLASRSQ